ncbi:MAG: queuosine precursor transporter [Planctomycetes bacterium]|nr:queuosine precursor transporter [Planctomycetota bacterium]
MSDVPSGDEPPSETLGNPAPEQRVGGFPVRERIFLVLAGVFLASMVCMNVLGITKFIQIGGWTFEIFGEPVTLFQLAIGVLPYPVTFLATDLVCELYGKKRASFLVWTGFGLNLFLLAVCGLGYALGSAPFDAHGQFYAQAYVAMGGAGAPPSAPASGAFYGQVWSLMWGATAASMVAYLVAQLIDVHLFHFWKDLTGGRHLWLRNNGSTIVSQLVDTVCVLTITFWGELASGEKSVSWLLALILGTYAFKLLVALLDTPLFYLGTYLLKPWVGDEPEEPAVPPKVT